MQITLEIAAFIGILGIQRLEISIFSDLETVGEQMKVYSFYYFFYRLTAGTLILIWGVTASSGQPVFDWTYFGPDRGMGMSFNTILQDRQGFLWLGSTNGLYRYDGYELSFFKKYSRRSTGLSSDWIWDLAEDEESNIWIATYNGGLNRWDRRNDRITHYRHDAGNPATLSGDGVLKLQFAPSGELWMIVLTKDGEPALNKLDPGSGQIKRYPGLRPVLIAQPAANINPLAFDTSGRLWIATRNGLKYYEPGSDTFRPLPLQSDDASSSGNEQVINIYPSPAGENTIWVATAAKDLQQGAIYRVDTRSRQSERLFGAAENADDAVISLWQAAGDPESLWFSNTRLHRLQLSSGKHQIFDLQISSGIPENAPLRSRLQTFRPDQNGNLWISPLGLSPAAQIRGSDNYFSVSGVEKFDTTRLLSRYFSRHPLHPEQPFPSVRSMMEDRSGMLWFGALFGFFKLNPGIHPNRPAFTNYQLPRTYADPNQPTNLRAVWPANADILWLGSYNGGLQRLDRRSGEWTGYGPETATLRHKNIYSLYYDEETARLWIGHEKGIDRLPVKPGDDKPPPSSAFKALRTADGLLDSRINTIAKAGAGKVWIGTATNGLLLFDLRAEKVLQQYTDEELPDNFIQSVFSDSEGNLWVGANMGGCCRLTKGEPTPAFECFLDGLYIVDFQETGDTLWMAAMNYGLVRFDTRRDTFELLTMDNRLLRNTATGIEADHLGRLWFTSLGLSRHDPDTDTYQFYDRGDGILDLDPERCFFKTPEGVLIYAGVNGALQLFDPEAVKDNPVLPKVVLTGFQLFNRSLQLTADGPLTSNIEVTGKIRLDHRQHSFSIQYAGLEFTEPLKNKYRYRLVGVDSDWIYAGARREARYNNVPPGEYTFQVDAANADGLWSKKPAQLDILVRPPWWERSWAFALFFLAGVGMIATVYRVTRRRLELRAQLKVEHEEALRLKKLDQAKNQFLSNLSHEFRTPMTLIKGLTEQLPEFHRRGQNERIREAIHTIQRNNGQLLNLVNQLLELSRIQTNSLPIHLEQGNIIPFLRYLTQAFRGRALQNEIDLRFESPRQELLMDFDQEKMQKIVSNLLSNALKFTPPGGRVVFFADETAEEEARLILEVRDTGIGIAAEEQETIFQSFYQVEGSSTRRREGTGIGLTLSHALVQMLGGNIRVHSRDGAGSTFVVELPITREAPTMGHSFSPEITVPDAIPTIQTIPTSQKKEWPLLLIVEDSKDVIRFLSYCLEDHYRLEVAGNGREGIEKATALTPDLIISDVMMPEADGLELCRVLKAQHSTSHIPIILLTARAGEKDLLAGLREGADAYLTKPFQREELLIRIDKLLELRRRLRERYSRLSPPPDVTSTPQDSFIKKARQLVEAHLGDDKFNVAFFAEAMNLSRTQLHRKLTYLTGKSAVQFIRQIRMEKALELLQNTDMNISEIAFATGYQDPAYFSRIFTQTYGQPPSTMR